MGAFDEWPASLRGYLRGACGEPLGVDDLGGMSDGSVWRVRFDCATAIVKRSPNDREFNFYRSIAESLSEDGIATPRLEWSGRGADGYWLVLEDVPEPLPSVQSDPWQPDERVLKTLRRLHTASIDPPVDHTNLFQPEWTAAMSEAALSLFSPEAAAKLTPALESLRLESQRLFTLECWISGDPNPRNWGVRADGTAVLFDWERFSRGTPALDLAIIVPGLGNEKAYRQVAGDYLGLCDLTRPPTACSVDQLAREISLAKAWTVIEFLAEYARSPATATEGIARWLVDAVPPWVAGIAGE